MDHKFKIGSPKSPQVPSPTPPQAIEFWEPPFERWIRLADDLLRDWSHSPAVPHDPRI